MTGVQKKLVQYFILAVVLLFLISVGFFIDSRKVRFLIVLSVSLVYFVFGILHHYEEKNLTGKVFWEFLAISLLAFIVLYSFFVAG